MCSHLKLGYVVKVDFFGRFSQDALTWEEAQTLCLGDEAKLVEIETPEENSAITAEIVRQGLTSKQLHFWLGLVDIDRTLPKNWVFDSTKEAPDWKGEWATGEGETRGEHCAFLWASAEKPRITLGSWHDINCGWKGFPFANAKTFLSLAALCGKYLLFLKFFLNIIFYGFLFRKEKLLIYKIGR